MSVRSRAAVLAAVVSCGLTLSSCGVVVGEALVRGEAVEPQDTAPELGEWWQEVQTVKFSISNETDQPLVLTYRTQDEGRWDGDSPGNIPPRTTMNFRFLNDEPRWGARNTLGYQLPEGEVSMLFGLPLLSLRYATLTVPKGYRGVHYIDPTGNKDVSAGFIILKDGR